MSDSVPVFRNYSFGNGSIGWLIALLVLIVCVVLWFLGKPLTSGEVLLLIGALALSRLL